MVCGLTLFLTCGNYKLKTDYERKDGSKIWRIFVPTH
nr:MAG TPA: hypothetical protein [Caudoviricetes sp.]DAW85451.1 MAG TPA: hypothetical protein [Bacteriophage sp.]